MAATTTATFTLLILNCLPNTKQLLLRTLASLSLCEKLSKSFHTITRQGFFHDCRTQKAECKS